MENKAHALIAGAFLLLLTASLIIGALWLGQRGASQSTYEIVTPYAVSGLNVQAPVKYRGVQIGTVSKIDFDTQNATLIRIQIEVDKNAPITKNTFAKLSYQGVTGLAYVELGDNGQVGARLATNDDHPSTIPMHPSFLAEVGNSGQVLLTRLNDLVDKLSKFGNPQNQAHITQILANVDQMSHDLVALESQLTPTLQHLPALTAAAQQTLVNANTVIKHLDTLTLSAQTRLKTVDQVGSSVNTLVESGQHVTRQISGSTLPELHTLIESLARTSQNVDRLANELQERPQSLIFGKRPPPPGPGETGFKMPPAQEPTP